MVETEKLYYRTKFDEALDPVKDLLHNEKGELPLIEWLRLVEKVKESIKKNPQQQLGTDLPPQAELDLIIDELFQNFLKVEILLS